MQQPLPVVQPRLQPLTDVPHLGALGLDAISREVVLGDQLLTKSVHGKERMKIIIHKKHPAIEVL